MSRLSREKKREQQHAMRPAAAVTPLDVHVAGGGPATIGGVPVVAADGQEIQQAVLGHLHRVALATGHAVVATVHDERIGYVVPLRVETDGSSHFAGEPLRVAPPRGSQEPAPAPSPAPLSTPPSAPPAVEPSTADPSTADPSVVDPSAVAPFTADPPAEHPRRDKATHLLRAVPEPVKETAPTFPLRAVPEPRPQDEVPAPGTVTAPTGVFGPPPTMDTPPSPEPGRTAPDAESAPVPAPAPVAPAPAPATTPVPAPAPEAGPHLGADPDPDPKPTPARGFDAVAEAVLGDDPRTLPGEDGAPALLGEPMAQINEAVRSGRIDTAAALAERTVAEASGTLGPEHPEVLRLRELTAYIAYLAGDPLRSFHLSLDLARIRRRARDAEAAYGNVQSAAAAWRAVRDPLQGLNLGTELLALWSDLTTEEGPAAEDVEQLESARARMTRLTERARTSGALRQG
ncbi:tetratricopeptide repeat protein [Streptomyces sp. NPDC017936]|uniref:tetratricopeptide repeat protein n=1 Tax=Streptomyces sp. NPDC017936 TaxID=3365016 RepID=UPI0037891C2E